MKWLQSYIRIILLVAVISVSSYAGEIESLGGWEGDSHGVGYGYFGLGTDIVGGEKLSLISRLTGSYLYYNFDKLDSSIEFKSPGVSLLMGFKIAIKKSTLILLSGAEYRWNREDIRTISTGLTEIQRKNKLGAVFQGFLFTPLASRTQFMLLLNYDGSNQYIFSRLTLKQEFSGRAPAVGLEGTAQGNDDISSIQVGAFIESPRMFEALSLKLSGGYKKSWLPEDLQESSAYAGLSFYGRF